MDKIKIKLIILGNLPRNINYYRIVKWTSDLFQIVDKIDKIPLRANSDLNNWGFSDEIISDLLPDDYDADILIAITSVPLEANYYVRRFSHNRICVTLFEIGDFLRYESIPLENLILRLLYSASFIYLRYNKDIPDTTELTDYTHDETKGCIFDMNGIKNDIIYSTNKPILCSSCVNSLSDYGVSNALIVSARKELKKINKEVYYKIMDLIKEYPICAIVISSVTAIILGVISSIIASYIIKN